jgi:4-amino-4-deoxy-L-arabinose transferase-like glycosyltransferase
VNGVAVTSAFGLGCVAAVYALGTVLYGKKTGLVAAALFGFIPWHVYLSRIFLIDNQCLFLSLLFLTVGIMAVKRNSEKLVAVAGVFFALAFLTKLFAVFALVPLALIILLNRKEIAFKLDARKILFFLLPTLFAQAVWFGGFANQNFFAVYLPSDFTHPVLVLTLNSLFCRLSSLRVQDGFSSSRVSCRWRLQSPTESSWRSFCGWMPSTLEQQRLSWRWIWFWCSAST